VFPRTRQRQRHRRRLRTRRQTRRSLPSLKIASVSTTFLKRSARDAANETRETRDAPAARRLINMYDERQRRGNGRARRFLVTTVTETSNADACVETRLNCLKRHLLVSSYRFVIIHGLLSLTTNMFSILI